MSVSSRLVPIAVSSFAVQLGLAAYFVPRAEDRFYDLSGAAGFLTTTLVSIYYPFLRSRLDAAIGNINIQRPVLSLAPRQLLLTTALVIWTGRLGTFLAQRAIKAGGDARFDAIKRDKAKFTAAWIAQATWIFVVGLPVYLSNLVPASAHPPLRARDVVAFAFIVASFALEVIADRQKSVWRHARDALKAHDERFITTGLWAWSRHPNYVGEVGIWTGMWSLAAISGALSWQGVFVSAASPVGTYFLIRYVSGVPLLERAGDKKFGDNPKWKEYKRTVPVFFPWGGYE